jgi:hypothetical protein
MLETLSVDVLLMEPPAPYTAVAPPDALVTSRIHHIRGQKVMLDRDLAELYGVETKHLKRQVKRNLARFPEDFMFELTASEWATLRYQFGTSNKAILSERGGSRVLPMAFTEQGVAMLSSVLGSEQAILVNIHNLSRHSGIIRVFTRMREVLLSHREILQKLEQLEGRVTGHDDEIQAIFDHLTELVTRPEAPRRSIGFKPNEA